MGRKILLADDSITIQKVVNLTFSDEGIEVITVSNGEMAVNKLDSTHPDIVLADIFMPGRNGYEVCEYVKTHPQFQHLPVLLLVGAFEPFDKQEASRVRADGHLTKPFESRTLIATVKRLLERVPVSAPPPSAPPPAMVTPPPELTSTRIFGSSPDPTSIISESSTIVFNRNADASPTSAEPSSQAEPANLIEEGRQPDLIPLIPSASAEPLTQTEPVAIALTLPENTKPSLTYPKPPSTQYRSVDSQTFITSDEKPVEASPNLLVDTQSPLEIDDDVIHLRGEPTANLILDARDPLLDTFADVAVLTASAPSAFDPQVETTAHAGTDAAYVSTVSEATQPTTELQASSTPIIIQSPFDEVSPSSSFSFESHPASEPISPEAFAHSISHDAPPIIQASSEEVSQPERFPKPETAAYITEKPPSLSFEVSEPPPAVQSLPGEITQPEFLLESEAARDIPPPPQSYADEDVIEAISNDVSEAVPLIFEPSAADESSHPQAPASNIPSDPPVLETPLVFEPATEDETVAPATGNDFLPTELAAALQAKGAFEVLQPPEVVEAIEATEYPVQAPPIFAFTLPPEPEATPTEVPPSLEPTTDTAIASSTVEPEFIITQETSETSSESSEVVPNHVHKEHEPTAAFLTAVDAPDLVEPTVANDASLIEVPVEEQDVEMAAPAPSLDAQSVPQSVIDQIVQRVIAQLSEKIIREIAWEVVPDLAELLIKERLSKQAIQTNGGGSYN